MGNVIHVNFKKEKKRRKWKKKRQAITLWWKLKHSSMAWGGIIFMVFVLIFLVSAKSCLTPTPYERRTYEQRSFRP